MKKERLTAFSDGVIAIIITIMVLELKVPHSADWGSLTALAPTFLSYVLSFVYIAIYWNNHHHLLYACEHVNGAILWANMHLLFWLSLIPFATGWMGENHFAALPTALYDVSLRCRRSPTSCCSPRLSACTAARGCWRAPSAPISKARYHRFCI
jgi:TMEM175 potassium channel family protein